MIPQRNTSNRELKQQRALVVGRHALCPILPGETQIQSHEDLRGHEILSLWLQ
jgi:hypothetical protein